MSYIKVSGVRGRPGYARIEIGYALSVEPLLFTLQRTGADRRYLSSEGTWRGEPDPLKPQQVELREGKTFLSIGPEIVDRVGEDERLRVEIMSAGFVADVVWSDVPPSSGRIGAALFPSRPAVAPAPPPPPPPPPPEPEQAKPPEPPPAPAPLPVPQPTKRRPWALIAGLALLLILILAAAAGWYWRPQLIAMWNRWTHPQPIADVDGDQLRRQLADLMNDPQGDPARILDGGVRLLDNSKAELRDFGFRAVDVAATRGSVVAQLAIGRLYDPRHFKAGRGGMEKPNASVAAYWYQQAKDASPDAAQELRELCTRLAQPSDDIADQEREVVRGQYCN